MIALLRKDWRTYRVPIMGSIITLLLAYLIMLDLGAVTSPFQDILEGAAKSGMGITFVMAAAYGGAAFATERRERSADFLALLPVSKVKIVFSKAIVCGVCLGSMFLLNGYVLLRSEAAEPMAISLAVFAGVTLLTFGGGWLLSTFLESPAMAASGALGFLVATMATIGIFAPHRTAWILVPAVAGVANFVSGAVYYIRRVEP